MLQRADGISLPEKPENCGKNFNDNCKTDTKTSRNIQDDSLPNVLITQLVDEEVCNPLKVWHELGEHANPSQEEIELLRRSAEPFVQTKRCGNKIKLTLKQNAVCYFEIKHAPIKSDRGYTYGR